MATVQTDLSGALAGGPRYVEMIKRRMHRDPNHGYSVIEVAGLFGVSDTKVREWIEEGRLPAANLNAGMTCPEDPERPGGARRPIRPMWRMSPEAVLAHAANMEGGL